MRILNKIQGISINKAIRDTIHVSNIKRSKNIEENRPIKIRKAPANRKSPIFFI